MPSRRHYPWTPRSWTSSKQSKKYQVSIISFKLRCSLTGTAKGVKRSASRLFLTLSYQGSLFTELVSRALPALHPRNPYWPPIPSVRFGQTIPSAELSTLAKSKSRGDPQPPKKYVVMQLKKAKCVSICGKPFSKSLGKRAQWVASFSWRHTLQPVELLLGMNVPSEARRGQRSSQLPPCTNYQLKVILFSPL